MEKPTKESITSLIYLTVDYGMEYKPMTIKRNHGYTSILSNILIKSKNLNTTSSL